MTGPSARLSHSVPGRLAVSNCGWGPRLHKRQTFISRTRNHGRRPRDARISGGAGRRGAARCADAFDPHGPAADARLARWVGPAPARCARSPQARRVGLHLPIHRGSAAVVGRSSFGSLAPLLRSVLPGSVYRRQQPSSAECIHRDRTLRLRRRIHPPPEPAVAAVAAGTRRSPGDHRTGTTHRTRPERSLPPEPTTHHHDQRTRNNPRHPPGAFAATTGHWRRGQHCCSRNGLPNPAWPVPMCGNGEAGTPCAKRPSRHPYAKTAKPGRAGAAGLRSAVSPQIRERGPGSRWCPCGRRPGSAGGRCPPAAAP